MFRMWYEVVVGRAGVDRGRYGTAILCLPLRVESHMAEPMAEYLPAIRPVPLLELLPWAAFAGVLALLAIYFVGAEQGATSLIAGHYIHEFVHDGRHLLGLPCH